MGQEGHRPDRTFQAKGDGQRLLQVGAAGHHGVAVLLRLSDQGGQDRAQFGFDQVQAIADLQHGRGVHDVLRGGAPMGPAGCRPRCFRQARDQADDGITDIAGACGKVLGAEVLHPRGSDNGIGGVGWDDAHAALDTGKRGLHIQHPLEIGGFIEDRAHGVAAVKRAEDWAVGGVNGHGTILLLACAG